MIQGLGLGLNKDNFLKKYPLDLITGAVNSLVLGFSFYKLTNKYNGYCIQVTRDSDLQTMDIGFVDGYIDITSIETFCTGTTGRISIFYNQSQFTGIKNAIQVTLNNMPIIYQAGTFINTGIKFISANNSRMTIDDYPAIDIKSPELSIYLNYYPINSTGYIFGKFLDPLTLMQYAATSETNFIYTFLYDWTVRTLADQNSTVNKYLFNWINKNANGLRIINQIGNIDTTLSNDLLNGGDLTLGYCFGDPTFLFNGDLKTFLIFNSNQYNNYSNLSNL
ncbi:MAG: hypothetical protein JXB50_08085 [Spirochaetes bacterium]|nr:hypothetical protein [Spirochaetota bacterium]